MLEDTWVTARVKPVNVRTGRRTLSQAVTAEILERIRAGQYQPGDRLATERSLMEQFGVGRNVAREAIQALLAMGLIEVRPGRGAIVIGVDTNRAIDSQAVSALLRDQTVDDLYEFRRVIEVEIAIQAARRASEADLKEIERRLAAFREQVERGESLAVADVALHEAIADASHNSIYARVLLMLEETLAHARGMTESIDWARSRSLTDHEAIVAAIAAHDPHMAGDAMRAHMRTAFEAMAAARAARNEPSTDEPTIEGTGPVSGDGSTSSA